MGTKRGLGRGKARSSTRGRPMAVQKISTQPACRSSPRDCQNRFHDPAFPPNWQSHKCRPRGKKNSRRRLARAYFLQPCLLSFSRHPLEAPSHGFKDAQQHLEVCNESHDQNKRAPRLAGPVLWLTFERPPSFGLCGDPQRPHTAQSLLKVQWVGRSNGWRLHNRSPTKQGRRSKNFVQSKC